ncbi:hypothetical protein HAV15_002953 [Penicillium sp. str. |nr:hypothetical protein HAV15_002953 [Penicillium sp. str. \
MTVFRESRGFELETFNSAILPSVLKKQFAKWLSLAEGCICDIISMVHFFTSKVLNISCGDQRLGQNILSFLMNGLIETSVSPFDDVFFPFELRGKEHH